MNTLNTGRTSDTQSPHRAGALKQKIKNTLTTAATALSLVVPTIKADTTETPHSTPAATILPCTKQIISGEEAPTQTDNSSYNLIRTLPPINTVAEGKTRFIITTDSPGILTISWIGSVGTGISFNYDSPGYAGTNYRVKQIVQFGAKDEPMTTISILGDELIRLNSGTTMIDHSDENEGFRYINVPQTATVSIPAAGEYCLDNIAQITNTTGGAAMRGVQFSFAPTTLNIDVNKNSTDNGGSTNTSTLPIDPNSDPDGDGIPNLVEYGFNTDPLKANASPLTYSIEKATDGKNYLTVTFPKNPDATNLTYSVEASSDLKTWTSNTVSLLTSNTQGKVRDSIPTNEAPQRFMRVRIEAK